MDISELREQINEIDHEIVELYGRRMETARAIGRYKREHNLPVLDSERERSLLNKVAEQAGEENEQGVRALYHLLIDHSRMRQEMDGHPGSPLGQQIREIVAAMPAIFPEKAMIACQGVEGAYSQLACEKMIRYPSILYCRTFENVFGAIESGLCQYGILPIENSLAGSVNSVYDLMIRHHCYIVRSVRIKIDHTLLALPGTRMDEIREIYSHEQAIQQCSAFLSQHKEWHVNVCTNTAAAARMVAESGRRDAAAISSGHCAALYGLECLSSDIQNNSNNHTRFICISKKPEIYPGADHTSLMLVLPNHPGSLYQLLSRFNALDINLIKLESRPLPGRDFEFMFYFDLEASVGSPTFSRLIEELDITLNQFSYLGSYSEIV
ncbi:MAG: prephenate dehydratase [Lachnospiraceae bacterium]|nr:prephenate dehydratase [Lachnospiraceae bacterium]